MDLTDQEVSRRMAVLSVLAMVAVVMIHSNTIGTLPEPTAWNAFFQQAFSRIGTAWAVPFFFLQAGYWAAKGNYGGFLSLLRKKTRGLLLPYVLWAIIGTIMALPLICFNNWVTARPILDRTVFEAQSIWAFLDGLLGVTRNGPQGNLALWFVRTLMVLFLLFPLWRCLAKLSKWNLLVLGAFCILAMPSFAVPYLSIRGDSIGFFLFGLGVAGLDWGRVRLPWWIFMIVSIFWGGLILFGTLSALDWRVLPFPMVYLVRVLPLVGILFWVGFYDCCKGAAWRFPRGMTKTFWIYCMHGSLVGYFTVGGYYLIGKTNTISIVLAILAPVPTIMVCALCYSICERIFPKTTRLLTGGR